MTVHPWQHAGEPRAFSAGGGGGHWVTITSDEGIETHIFISAGGRVTKGPSHLIGCKAGHLSAAPHRSIVAHPEGHEPKGAKDHPMYTEHEAKRIVHLYGRHGPGVGYDVQVNNNLPDVPSEQVPARLKAAEQTSGRRTEALKAAPSGGEDHAAAGTRFAQDLVDAAGSGQTDKARSIAQAMLAHRDVLATPEARLAFASAFKTAHQALTQGDGARAAIRAGTAARASLGGEHAAPISKDEATALTHRATVAAYGAEYERRTGLSYHDEGPYLSHEQNTAELSGKRADFYAAAHAAAHERLHGADLSFLRAHHPAFNAAQRAGYATGTTHPSAAPEPLPEDKPLTRTAMIRKGAQEALENTRNVNAARETAKIPDTDADTDFWGPNARGTTHQADYERAQEIHQASSALRAGPHKDAYDAAVAALGDYRPTGGTTTAKFEKRLNPLHTSSSAHALHAAQDAMHKVLFGDEGEAAYGPKKTPVKAPKAVKAEAAVETPSAPAPHLATPVEAERSEAPSKGHAAIIGDHEYFHGPTGDLYRAPKGGPLDAQGYRQGARFESTAVTAPMALHLARSAAALTPPVEPASQATLPAMPAHTPVPGLPVQTGFAGMPEPTAKEAPARKELAGQSSMFKPTMAGMTPEAKGAPAHPQHQWSRNDVADALEARYINGLGGLSEIGDLYPDDQLDARRAQHARGTEVLKDAQLENGSRHNWFGAHNAPIFTDDAVKAKLAEIGASPVHEDTAPSRSHAPQHRFYVLTPREARAPSPPPVPQSAGHGSFPDSYGIVQGAPAPPTPAIAPATPGPPRGWSYGASAASQLQKMDDAHLDAARAWFHHNTDQARARLDQATGAGGDAAAAKTHQALLTMHAQYHAAALAEQATRAGNAAKQAEAHHAVASGTASPAQVLTDALHRQQQTDYGQLPVGSPAHTALASHDLQHGYNPTVGLLHPEELARELNNFDRTPPAERAYILSRIPHDIGKNATPGGISIMTRAHIYHQAQAAHEADTAAAGAHLKGLTLAKLEGSPKQVDWAGAIRGEHLAPMAVHTAALQRIATSTGQDEDRAEAELAQRTLHRLGSLRTSAHTWIEQKSYDPERHMRATTAWDAANAQNKANAVHEETGRADLAAMGPPAALTKGSQKQIDWVNRDMRGPHLRGVATLAAKMRADDHADAHIAADTLKTMHGHTDAEYWIERRDRTPEQWVDAVKKVRSQQAKDFLTKESVNADKPFSEPYLSPLPVSIPIALSESPVSLTVWVKKVFRWQTA